MFNRLSETRFFNKANQVFNFEKNLSSVNLSYYKVPYELYKDRMAASHHLQVIRINCNYGKNRTEI